MLYIKYFVHQFYIFIMYKYSLTIITFNTNDYFIIHFEKTELIY